MVMAVRVLDEQGVRAFGQIPLFYQSETESLDVTKVEVVKPDGSVTPTGAGGMQDLAVRLSEQIPLFVDVRQKMITVSALRPGDTVRLEARWTTTKPIAPGEFWFEYSFNRKDPVVDEQLEIDVPADRAVAIESGATGPAEASGGRGTVETGRRIYRWKTAHAADAAPPEPPEPGVDRPAPDVRLSTFEDWNEFAGWFYGLASASPDAAVKAKAAALTAGAPDEAAKIDAIYGFVSKEIRYVSLSFGLGRFAAHPPAQVLANQYGDCKDKAVLLEALLQAAGIRSVPVLVNTTRSVAADFASPMEFDHMIAMIPRGADPAAGLWMDATLEVAPAGMLSEGVRDRQVLRLDGPKRASVVRAPADPPFPSILSADVDGAVNALGVLTAKVTVAARGDVELFARAVVRSVPREKLKEFVTGFVSAFGIDGDVFDVSTSDPTNTMGPFTFAFQWRKGGFLDWAAADSRLPALFELPFADSRGADGNDLKRVYLGSPRKIGFHARIALPDGYDIETPQPVEAAQAGLAYASAYALDGRTLVVDREVTLGAREIPASAFGAYAAFRTTVEADLKQRARVHGHVTAAPEVPAGATADELYHAAYAAYQAKRYDAAVALWTRNTEIDPKMGTAWDALGLAYQKLEKYDEAAAAIQKQIDLDPYNKRAYSDLASVLKNAGKKALAAKAYARHVELNPLDGDAFKELGYLYEDLDRYGEAAAALEKAVGLLKRDEWLEANLAAAYLHLEQPDKARAAVAKALEFGSGAALKNKLAWDLAVAGVDLDRALELGLAAERDLSDRTRALDLSSVTSSHLDDVDTLAALWDTLGWIYFKKGDLEAADRYVRAAWQLGGQAEVAYHLGQVSEKRDKLADALSFYLTAQALYLESARRSHDAHQEIFRRRGFGSDGEVGEGDELVDAHFQDRRHSRAGRRRIPRACRERRQAGRRAVHEWEGDLPPAGGGAPRNVEIPCAVSRRGCAAAATRDQDSLLRRPWLLGRRGASVGRSHRQVGASDDRVRSAASRAGRADALPRFRNLPNNPAAEVPPGDAEFPGNRRRGAGTRGAFLTRHDRRSAARPRRR